MNPVIQTLKAITPPILFSMAKAVLEKKNLTPPDWVLMSGDFIQDQQGGPGFDDDEILRRCSNAMLKVKNKEAIYERDSVLLEKIEYSFGLLAGLQKVAMDHNNSLSVLDFGGSLGSTYYQNKEFLNLQDLEWSIVEQEGFVKMGREQFEDDILKFYYTIEECVAARKPNVLVLSGVLQYLDNAYCWIEKFLQLGVSYIILDRTAFSESEQEIYAIQNIPERIYHASFKHLFFNEEKLLSKMTGYTAIADFKSFADSDSILPDGTRISWKGFIFQRTKI